MIRHNDLTLSYLESNPSGTGRKGDPLIVLIHGRGADATDLAPLAEELGGDLPCRFVLPDAPRRFEVAPGLEIGYTWFDGYPPSPASLAPSRESLRKFLREVQERYEVGEAKTLLLGFSQGALMALDAGLRSERRLAGIVALSGAIDEPNLPGSEIRSKPPVLFIVGTRDAAIPIDLPRAARKILQEAGIEPEYHELPIGHEITPEELEMIRRFVRTRIQGEEAPKT